jgi:hypothetical protein
MPHFRNWIANGEEKIAKTNQSYVFESSFPEIGSAVFNNAQRREKRISGG